MQFWQKDWRDSSLWLCATVVVFIGVFLSLVPLGAPFWRMSYDLPLLCSSPANITNVVLVYVDDDSLRTLKARPDGTLDRRLHAQLLERLSADGAGAVVFDLLFRKGSLADSGDRAFAAALQKHGHVVLAEVEEFESSAAVDKKRLVSPAAMFATNAFASGVATFESDRDGVARRMSTNREALAWIALKTADVFAPGLDDTAERERWLKHYLPRRSGSSAFDSVSFQTAIASNGTPAGFFTGKVVFVGARHDVGPVAQLRDRFATPFSAWDERYAPLPGVELHATAFANVARGEWLAPVTPVQAAVINGLIGFGVVALCYPRRRTPIVLLFFCAVVVVALAGFFLQHRFYFVTPWLILAAVQLPIAFVWMLGRNANLPGKPEAFISYRRVEGEGSGYALGMYHALRARGVESYWDMVSLDEGAWKAQLREHIKDAPNFLLLITKDSLNRTRLESLEEDMFREEIELARKLKKKIIPVLFEGAKIPSDLPTSLAWLHDRELQPQAWEYKTDDALRLAERVLPCLKRRNFVLRWRSQLFAFMKRFVSSSKND